MGMSIVIASGLSVKSYQISPRISRSGWIPPGTRMAEALGIKKARIFSDFEQYALKHIPPSDYRRHGLPIDLNSIPQQENSSYQHIMTAIFTLSMTKEGIKAFVSGIRACDIFSREKGPDCEQAQFIAACRLLGSHALAVEVMGNDFGIKHDPNRQSLFDAVYFDATQSDKYSYCPNLPNLYGLDLSPPKANDVNSNNYRPMNESERLEEDISWEYFYKDGNTDPARLFNLDYLGTLWQTQKFEAAINTSKIVMGSLGSEDPLIRLEAAIVICHTMLNFGSIIERAKEYFVLRDDMANKILVSLQPASRILVEDGLCSVRPEQHRIAAKLLYSLIEKAYSLKKYMPKGVINGILNNPIFDIAAGLDSDDINLMGIALKCFVRLLNKEPDKAWNIYQRIGSIAKREILNYLLCRDRNLLNRLKELSAEPLEVTDYLSIERIREIATNGASVNLGIAQHIFCLDSQSVDIPSLKKVYWRLMRQLHPDHNHQAQEQATKETVVLVLAWEQLSEAPRDKR